MNRLNFFNTFRGRLLIVFAVLLIATLGVQYYLNLRSEKENAERRERQERTLVAGITLGFNSISSNDSLNEFKEKQAYFQEYRDRIEDVLIIDNEWQVYDAFNEKYLYTRDENSDKVYKKLADLHDLPPLQDAESLGADREKFPNAVNSNQTAKESENKSWRFCWNCITALDDTNETGEAHAIPVQTSEGRWYVMVILKSERGLAGRRAAQTLVYPLAVLLTAILGAFFLVWRFTRPIKNLSYAARRVAEGDLSVRVEHETRRDEMGRLAAQFNEMIAGLERTRNLEAQLREAEKSAVVGRLGSAIAHEIRNPLNYINLTLDHLRAKFAPQEAEKQETFNRLVSQLKEEVARINHQITEFLRYSRPLKLNLQRTDVRRVIEDSMRIVEAQATEQNVAISIVERGEISPVLGDAEHLRSVFNNLFVNAVQAMREGGTLTVTIEDEESQVKIEVADTGCGISEEILSKIFEPYFSTKETGTGLGLAIVKKIVDDHNGTIEVESKLNEETIFTVKLPKAN